MAPIWWVAIVTAAAYSLALVVPVWRICARAGQPPALGLLMLVPVLGWFVPMAVLAFGGWRTEAADGPDPDKSIMV